MESHRVNSIISGRSPPFVGTPKQKQTSYYYTNYSTFVYCILYTVFKEKSEYAYLLFSTRIVGTLWWLIDYRNSTTTYCTTPTAPPFLPQRSLDPPRRRV